MTLAELFDIAEDARALGRDVAPILAQAGAAAAWFEVLRPAKRQLQLRAPRSMTNLSSFDAMLKRYIRQAAVATVGHRRHPLLPRG